MGHFDDKKTTGDQAFTLRKMMKLRDSQTHSRIPSRAAQARSARVVTVASGKGGVGKSCLVANLGTLLARQGLKVLLIDGDSGLANLDILLNAQSNATLEQVLSGQATLNEAIIGIEPNLWLIPASSGLLDIRTSQGSQCAHLLEILEEFPWEMDLVLIDVGAGIQPSVISLHSPAYESLVMITPEPTSLADSYGLIKLLKREKGISNFNVIVNQVTDGREGQQTFQKLKEVAGRFLPVQLDYLGHWNRDSLVTQSVMKRKILLDLDKQATSVASLELLAKRVRSKTLGLTELGLRPTNRFRNEQAFWEVNTAGFWRSLLGEVKA